MSDKSHWLLIGFVTAAMFFGLGMVPAAVSVSGPSLLVFLALAWIAVRGSKDLRSLVDKAQPYLRETPRALEDEPARAPAPPKVLHVTLPPPALPLCGDCGQPLHIGAHECARCGHLVRVRR